MKTTASALAAFAVVSAASIAQAQQYVISTYAGGAPPQTPMAGVNMAIAPQALAADPSGNLYFISSNCVFKLDLNEIVTRVAGNSRKTGNSGDGGPALGAEFRAASGVAVDAAGDVYVADAGDYRVRKVSPGGIISTMAGTGVQGYSGDSASATSAQLTRPSGLTTDSGGNYSSWMAPAYAKSPQAASSRPWLATDQSVSPATAVPLQARN